MAILKIAKMGHPALQQPAQPVGDPTAVEIRDHVQDMTETLVDAEGAGLAAPQVHVPLRLVMFHVPVEKASIEDNGPGQGCPEANGAPNDYFLKHFEHGFGLRFRTPLF